MLMCITLSKTTNILRRFHLTFEESKGLVVGGLSGRTRVLQGLDSFPKWSGLGETAIEVQPGQPSAFAFIGGIKSEDLLPYATPTEFTVVVRLLENVTDKKMASVSFGIRRPPIALVHGYHSDGTVWKGPFLDSLVGSRGADFVGRLSYGSRLESNGSRENGNNNTESLKRNVDYLSQALDFSIEEDKASFQNADVAPIGMAKPPLSDWYFLRYDLVAHSQGGVLARMLARELPYEESRFFNWIYLRGRFRRIITIGSPHNGSTILYYSLAVLKKNPLADFAIFAVDGTGVLRPKFDPFGEEIPEINGWNVDPKAKFHLLRTFIDGPPNSAPPSYGLIGLLGGTADGKSRKDIVLPLGSDGVVDFESQGGGPGSRVTGLTQANIAHAVGSPLFSITPIAVQTASSLVGDKVRALLDGLDSNFGRFYPVTSLDAERQKKIDEIVPEVSVSDLIHIVSGQNRAAGSTALSFHSTINSRFTLDIPQDMPLRGQVSWQGAVYGPTGVSSDGLILSTDGAETSQIAVTVNSNVVGEVVLRASCLSTSNRLVLALSVLVASFPPGPLLIIKLEPAEHFMSVSNTVELEAWGVYSNGIQSRLFISPTDNGVASAYLTFERSNGFVVGCLGKPFPFFGRNIESAFSI